MGTKENPQWLWLVMHSRTRQIVAMRVGSRSKETGEYASILMEIPRTIEAACESGERVARQIVKGILIENRPFK